jgi:pimeloyl-ACP methyl ester carboxylesterase
MPRNHTVQARMLTPVAAKSEACWALHENGKLLLFVHGFGGSATGTWRSFRELLLEDPVFSGYDMVFYGYESRRARASVSAELLFDFVNRFLRAPSSFANHSLEVSRDDDFKYSEIFLISHSLGGPVTRAMLVDAWKNKVPWLRNVRMIFYAPATAGARVEKLARSAGTQGILSLTLFWFWAVYRWPVMDDLRKDSKFLANLLSETRRGLRSRNGGVFQSRGTIFGERENIVEKAELDCDKPYIKPPFRDKDHFTVCKPNSFEDAAYVRLKQLVTKGGNGSEARERKRRPPRPSTGNVNE